VTTTMSEPKSLKAVKKRPYAAGPQVDGGSSDARRTAAAILDVLGGVRTPSDAAVAVGVSLPRYYALGVGAAATAVACAAVLARHAAAPGWWRAATVALALGLAATAWAGAVAHPRAQRLRAAQAAGQAPADRDAFRAAHRLAVVLNGAALLAALAGLGLSAAALRQ